MLYGLLILVLCFVFSTSKRANITLSGKKKNKLLKQLAHMEREKAGMDGNYRPDPVTL
jgi:hypothetical protein